MQPMSVIPPTELAQANVSQLSDEIAALSELGVWTEDDEKSVGDASDSSLEELELTRNQTQSDKPLA